MAEGQYRSDVDQLDDLETFDFENIFKMYQSDGYWFYNILKTVNISGTLDTEFYVDYKLDRTLPFTGISYKFYNTIKLWWLVALSNNIDNPVEMIKPGKTLKIIRPEYVRDIIEEINSQIRNG